MLFLLKKIIKNGFYIYGLKCSLPYFACQAYLSNSYSLDLRRIGEYHYSAKFISSFRPFL